MSESNIFWKELKKRKLALCASGFIALFFLIGLYAPFFANSKPFAVYYQGEFYFPLFRYLFYRGFYTKPIDLFYNVMMFTVPVGFLCFFLFKRARKQALITVASLQLLIFTLLMFGVWKDPAQIYKVALEETPDWQEEVRQMRPYAKLNLLLRYRQKINQQKSLEPYLKGCEKQKNCTLFSMDEKRYKEESASLKMNRERAKVTSEKASLSLPQLVLEYRPVEQQMLLAELALKESKKKLQAHDGASDYDLILADYLTLANTAKEKSAAIDEAKAVIRNYETLSAKEKYLEERREWERQENRKMKILLSPFFRPFHWEEDAGGGQQLNKVIPWWELTRLNRKDLAAAMLFGIRISLVVGMSAVTLALLIGIPLGVISGYFAGKTDIIICRLIEIWEAMPAFFMLLLIVAMVQSKSLFLVIGILGAFSWPHFTRYIRGEVLKQRNLPYVLAAKSLGFSHGKIMSSHILPNAIPPVLTLLPFSMMAAITSEAGLSFLGLGEEGSTSWGVLMAEGRSVFPGESYLLWPPAILLTLLLVSIALVGDAIRDALDPKMR